MTTAKFRCVSVSKTVGHVWSPDGKAGDGVVYEATLYPVTGDTEENKKFFASTPSGTIKLGTIREDHFIPGEAYYVDFRKAE
jgi:hypothetical protein